MSKKVKWLSDSKKLDVAIAVCGMLDIDPAQDENLWEMVELINFDQIEETEWA